MNFQGTETKWGRTATVLKDLQRNHSFFALLFGDVLAPRSCLTGKPPWVGWENILPPSFGCCSKLGFSLVFQKCFYVKDALRKEEEKKKKGGMD